MPLELLELSTQVRQMGELLVQRRADEQERLRLVDTMVAEWRDRWQELADLAETVQERVAVPTGPLDERIPAPIRPATYTAMATDGAEIDPDRHGGSGEFYLINVGKVRIPYGQPDREVELRSSSTLGYTEDDLFIVDPRDPRRQVPMRDRHLDALRTVEELRALADLAESEAAGAYPPLRGSAQTHKRPQEGRLTDVPRGRPPDGWDEPSDLRGGSPTDGSDRSHHRQRGNADEGWDESSDLRGGHPNLSDESVDRPSTNAGQRGRVPAVALVDGTLLFSVLEERPRDFLRNRFYNDFVVQLERLRRAKVAVAAYASRSRGTDLVHLFRAVCGSTPLVCDMCHGAHACALRGLTDAHLIARGLSRWDRSGLMRVRSDVHDPYYGVHRVYFFLLFTGDEIARIEIPEWVARDQHLLNLLHGVLVDQCAKGFGYPAVLARADDRAVISLADRGVLEQLVTQELARRGVVSRPSAKLGRKQVRTV